MLLRTLAKNGSLLQRCTASLYIYLRDHNKTITPENSKIYASYMHPQKIHPDAPTQPYTEYQLDPEMQELLERQIFEEYKNKLLRGIVDEEKEVEPDALWGEEPAPVHYFNNTSKANLMTVSHPQNIDILYQIENHYDPHFTSTYSGQISEETISKSDVHTLVQISLAARSQGVEDRHIWFRIEEGFGRGKKLYFLSSDQLVWLKWAFDGKYKKGTPIFHQILAALLKEDLPKMDQTLLFDLFYACRHSNPGKTNLQSEVLDLLGPNLRNLSFQDKVHFLLTFTLCIKPLKFGSKVTKRRMYEFKQFAASILLQLDLWDLQLTNQTTQQLIFALAKLHLENTKFLSLPLQQYIEENLESYCEDINRLYQAIFYLPQLEAGEGVMGQEMAGQLRDLALARWDQFSNIQRIRILHSLWNVGLMDETLFQYYKNLELETDSTLLYYACQIELAMSSEREWQIIQCLCSIEYIPLPYYTAYQRFYNYIKATTEWNLTPLADKLRNVEYYYSVMRQEDSMLRVKTFRKMKEFEKFTSVYFSEKIAPIANLQLAHFGYPQHQVSLDIISKKEFIPGTQQLKETYMNKVRSLSNLGWKHLAFSEEQLSQSTLLNGIENIQRCFQGHEEEQKSIIDYKQYKEGEEIQFQKMIEQMRRWDIDDINTFFSKIKGQEDIKLGDLSVESMSQSINSEEAQEELKKIQKSSEEPKKKKKK